MIDQIVFFQTDHDEIEPKKQLWRNFSDVITITSPEKRHKNFPFWAPLNQNFWLCQGTNGSWLENRKKSLHWDWVGKTWQI